MNIRYFNQTSQFSESRTNSGWFSYYVLKNSIQPLLTWIEIRKLCFSIKTVIPHVISNPWNYYDFQSRIQNFWPIYPLARICVINCNACRNGWCWHVDKLLGTYALEGSENCPGPLRVLINLRRRSIWTRVKAECFKYI